MSFTLLLIVVIVPIQFVLAFGMALLVNAKLQARGLFLYVFLLPLAISDLAAGIVWPPIFTELGYLNTVLEELGLIDQPYIWLDPTSSTQLRCSAVAVAEIWRSTAFIMMILFAGLQGDPEGLRRGGGGLRRGLLPAPPPCDAADAEAVDPGRAAPPPHLRVRGLRGGDRDDRVGRRRSLAAEAYKWQATNENEHVAAAYSLVILGLSLAAAAVVLITLRTPRERRLR